VGNIILQNEELPNSYTSHDMSQGSSQEAGDISWIEGHKM